MSINLVRYEGNTALPKNDVDLQKRFFTKEGLSGQENYYAGESGVCISVGKGTSGLYKNTCKKREDISVYRGIYRGTAG